MTDIVERLRHWSVAESNADKIDRMRTAAAEIERLRSEVEALRKDAELWRKALSAYERGVLMSHDGRTGEVDGYYSLFLQAIRERKAAMKEQT